MLILSNENIQMKTYIGVMEKNLEELKETVKRLFECFLNDKIQNILILNI